MIQAHATQIPLLRGFRLWIDDVIPEMEAMADVVRESSPGQMNGGRPFCYYLPGKILARAQRGEDEAVGAWFDWRILAETAGAALVVASGHVPASMVDFLGAVTEGGHVWRGQLAITTQSGIVVTFSLDDSYEDVKAACGTADRESHARAIAEA